MANIFVLAKKSKIGAEAGDAATVTIHGSTNIAEAASTWDSAAEENVSFTFSDEDTNSSFEPKMWDEQD